MIHSSVVIDPSQVAAHYDSLDYFYRDIWGEHVHHGYWERGDESDAEAVLHLSQVLTSWLNVMPGDRVCDIGCGYGGTSRLVAETYEADVVGYTVSRQQKAYAESIAAEKGSVDFRCQDFMSSALPDESFDAILTIECLEHFNDLPRAFDEIYRLLKPGRRFAIALWASCDNPNRMQTHTLQEICKEGRMPSLRSGAEYETQMVRSGFKVLEKREIGKQVQRTWTLCAKRFLSRLFTSSQYRTFLLDAKAKDRIFALTLFRIRLAFQTKTMRYWIYNLEKPSVS